ncbi:hypothetical protein C8P68_11225 [Mucilaginibacter yixingensis]|uniref:Fibronectin type III domain protein n=1 Tax=Mucilaginibacter yixingensis TaxID=1295612 RepID=A0A2T5J4I9_9SPHI|nr:hypothetical protein [Mucilaginibacter yixingensis]PTQ92425.1 hypothetical protein C8P68_11225 [Mucilaginibacter yixingensis]
MKINIKIWAGLVMIIGVCTSCSKDPLVPVNISSQLIVNTQPISNIGQNSAATGVQITGGFASDIIDKGICWATTTKPQTSQNKQSGGAGSGLTSLNISGLTPGITYYVRGYVVTKNETIYGDQQQFTTMGYLAATLTTTSISGITQTAAQSGGNVTAMGGGTVTAKGICWNTTGTPTISNIRTNDGSGLGAYTSSITSLTPGTTYYVRAYATNQAGTTYGSQVSFTTVAIMLPSVSATSITSIAQTYAIASASTTADGGGTISAKGFCWSMVTNPTISNAHVIYGSGLGSYGSQLSTLSPGTTYYVRAYATNQAGTAYGIQISFTTSPVQLATIGSLTISTITKNSAFASCSVTADGGGTITSRGICWSTSSSPTLSNGGFFTSGTGTGTLSGTMSVLNSGVTYYARGYAINAAGTAYGPVYSFKTL